MTVIMDIQNVNTNNSIIPTEYTTLSDTKNYSDFDAIITETNNITNPVDSSQNITTDDSVASSDLKNYSDIHPNNTETSDITKHTVTETSDEEDNYSSAATVNITTNSSPSDTHSDNGNIRKTDVERNITNQISVTDAPRVTITETSDDDDENYPSDTDSDSSDNNALQCVDNGGAPTFGSVSVVNSSDVHIGNRTVYQGPVTIKQFMYPNGVTNDTLEGCDSQNSCDKRAVNDREVRIDRNGIEKKPDIVASELGECGLSDQRRTKLRKGFIWLQSIPKQRPLEIGIFLTIILLSLSILLLVLFWKHPPSNLGHAVSFTDSDEQDNILPVDYQNELSNTSASNKLHIVTRQQWVAQPPVQPIDPLPTPVSMVIIHHTATENCSSQAQCVFHVRYIQTFHIESNDFWDIGYNFLVGGDGNAYEGRGWKEEGAHTFGYNRRSIGIAFIGSFLKVKPPLRQIVACKKLIQKGVELGYISKDYKILAVRQLRPTESPGLALFEEIKTWPHWSEEPLP